MPRPAYSQSEREDIETDIRNAALTLFRKVGYRGASLRSIARELGWSATALYRYYESKEALFAAVRAEGFKEMQTLLRQAREEAPSAADAGALGIQAYVRFADEKRALYQLMYELDQGDVAELPNVRAEREKAFAEAEAIAENLIKETGIRREPNELAHLMWVSAHGLATLHVASQLDLGKSVGELIEPTVQALMYGLLEREKKDV